MVNSPIYNFHEYSFQVAIMDCFTDKFLHTTLEHLLGEKPTDFRY